MNGSKMNNSNVDGQSSPRVADRCPPFLTGALAGGDSGRKDDPHGSGTAQVHPLFVGDNIFPFESLTAADLQLLSSSYVALKTAPPRPSVSRQERQSPDPDIVLERGQYYDQISTGRFRNYLWNGRLKRWRHRIMFIVGFVTIGAGIKVSYNYLSTQRSAHMAVSVPQEPQPEPVLLADNTPPVMILNVKKEMDLELVRIPAGSFVMGSPGNEQDHDSHEGPPHPVRIPHPFYMGKYPVTQGQWQAVMKTNPSAFPGDPRRPVENVSWNDCQEFCRKLEQMIGRTVRLPSEAEWEYACRAGTTTRFYFGNDPSYHNLDKYAWSWVNSRRMTQSVGLKPPNPWGLYDMSGNVWQWCQDKWHADYVGAPTDGQAWMEADDSRGYVLRGGSYYEYDLSCLRSAYRTSPGGDNCRAWGFRVVVPISDEDTMAVRRGGSLHKPFSLAE